MNKPMILGLSLLMTTTACSVTNKSVLSAPVGVSATSNLYATVDVGEKIEGTAKATTFLRLIELSGPDTFADGVFGGMAAGLKAAAAYNAMSKSGAEVIVNPHYVVNTKGGILFQTSTVNVTGYKGTISSIEDVGPADSE